MVPPGSRHKLFATHRSDSLNMALLGYAICTLLVETSVDDPNPLLVLDELSQYTRSGVLREIDPYLLTKPYDCKAKLEHRFA